MAVEQLHTAYIGSVIVDADRNLLPKGLNVARGALTGEKSVLHFPQTPQLGETFSMDPEATLGLPFLQYADGRLIYDFAVQADSGTEPGEITVLGENREIFDHLDIWTNVLIEAVEEGENDLFEQALSELEAEFPDIGMRPPGLEILRQSLDNGLIGIDDTPIKIQLSGPINTASAIYTRGQDGVLEKGKILQNERMLKIHSGLLLARSVLWVRSLEPYTTDGIICSFDEPCFENLDMDYGGAPRLSTALSIYQKLWGNPKLLPYNRMVHVCGSFVPEMLDNVDLLNFDTLKKAELLQGHGRQIEEFMSRGGKLVLGIIPTNVNHLQELVPEILSPQHSLAELFEDKDDLGTRLQAKLREKCVVRVREAIDRLVFDGVDRDLVMDSIVISPQCGLGGLSRHPDGGRYTDLVYRMTTLVAEDVFSNL